MKKPLGNGFTLIEVLLVIAILAILAAVTLIAINPSRQLAGTRDATRTSDVFTIQSALHQYASDNNGIFPAGMTTIPQEICREASLSCIGLVDLSVLVENQKYLVTIPEDPLCDKNGGVCTANGTGYFVSSTEVGGRITISAPGVEVKDGISTTR